MTNYLEQADSQIPALNLLRKLDWQYISPEHTIKERDGLLGNVILEDVLEERLKSINRFEYKGGKYPFSEGNIHAAIYALKNIPDEGLVRTSEKVYDLLTLGRSFEENVQGDKKSFTLNYIDWLHPENNVYHITDEFQVEGLNETRRPDLVLFVNGIPMVVIENKRRDKTSSLAESISQHIRNQKKEEGIPRLYHYAQLLLAVQPNEVKYATTDTSAKFWSNWREENDIEDTVRLLISSAKNGLESEERMPTVQDQMLYALCRKERVMELIYNFILFDAGIKKIARYQQYFSVQHSLQRIRETNADGNRRGGVIWHTQGSGKSLTMVMLAKAISIAEDIPNARVVIVTDRIDLDKQIWTTFHHCGKTPVRAKSGNHLIDLLENSSTEIVTTIIDKFETALNRKDFNNPSKNIFVLVDESHRSQYGKTHIKMKRVLPHACYIGFTGTPLLKSEKSTASKFGGFIDKYTIDQAVKDEAVVPLLYEGRSAKLSVNQAQIDKGFNRLSEPLGEYQTKDLKRKFSSIKEIYKSQQVVEEIAYDISEHYTKNWQGTGFKAMIAVPLKATAMLYQHYFENQTNPRLKVNTAVVISLSDTREDHEDVLEEANNDVQLFWKKVIERYGDAEKYENYVTEKFKSEDAEVEILIVVGKLLTGFDAPRCNTLYIAKPLAEHGLLQAIARANRLFPGKDFGHIIDYVGILGELDTALTQYSAFSEFDENDLASTVFKVASEVKAIAQKYSMLVDVFKEVLNKSDIEAMERHLAPQDVRDLFKEKLTDFGRCLQIGLSSDEFYRIYSKHRIDEYLAALKFYNSLRKSVQLRYAEKIDYKDYEKRVRKLLDSYIETEGIEQLTGPINIFDEEVFKKEVERMTGSVASKADAIAYKMKKVISEKMDEDPVFYKKFSQLIEATIKDFYEKRLNEAQYLETIINARKDLVDGASNDIPPILNGKPEARAFYGVVSQTLIDSGNQDNQIPKDAIAKMGIEMDQIISKLLIRDWHKNEDMQNQMKNQLEDYFLEQRKSLGLAISFTQLDKILDEVLKIAKSVY